MPNVAYLVCQHQPHLVESVFQNVPLNYGMSTYLPFSYILYDPCSSESTDKAKLVIVQTR